MNKLVSWYVYARKYYLATKNVLELCTTTSINLTNRFLKYLRKKGQIGINSII